MEISCNAIARWPRGTRVGKEEVRVSPELPAEACPTQKRGRHPWERIPAWIELYVKLELEAQFERQNTRPPVTGVLSGVCRGVRAGGGIESERRAEAAELGVVEDVERFDPEFEQTLLTADGNRFRERRIEVDPPRTVHDVGAGVSDGADGRQRERRGIEGQFAIGQGRIGGNIGEGVAHHVDAGTLIGGSRNILAICRSETRGERAAAVGGGDTRYLPVIGEGAEEFVVQGLTRLGKIVGVVDAQRLPITGRY